jgi:hypothetical protein
MLIEKYKKAGKAAERLYKNTGTDSTKIQF